VVAKEAEEDVAVRTDIILFLDRMFVGDESAFSG